MTKNGREIVQIILGPLIMTFFLVYILYFQYLKEISEILLNMSPALVFVIGGVLAWDQNRYLIARRKLHGELEQYMTITRYDIYYVTLVQYFATLGMFLIPVIGNKSVGIVDAIQALLVYLGVGWVRRRYFHFMMYRNQNNELRFDNTVVITLIDSMKLDALSFGLGLVLVGVPGIILQDLHVSDVIQACTGFMAIYFINVKYFRFTT